ncbi:MAG: amidohydrolase family protein [Acidimicrobiales bacterium]
MTVSSAGDGQCDSIDVHAHIVPTAVLDLVRAGEFPDVTVEEADDGRPFLAAGRDRLGPFQPSMTDLERRLGWLTERGIGQQWVSPWLDLFTWHRFPPGQARRWTSTVNRALLDLVELGRGHLRAVPAAHLVNGEEAAADLAAFIGDASAVVVNTSSGHGPRLGDPVLTPFWESLVDAGMPAILHPPADGPSRAFLAPILQNVCGRLIDTSAAVLDLVVSGVLERHPDLRLVAVHGGGLLPYQTFRLDGLARAGLLGKTSLSMLPSHALRHLYYDTVALDALSIEFLARRVGADHVLLGSDAPFPIGDPDPIGTIATARLTDAEKLNIRSRNAASLRQPRSGGHRDSEPVH